MEELQQRAARARKRALAAAKHAEVRVCFVFCACLFCCFSECLLAQFLANAAARAAQPAARLPGASAARLPRACAPATFNGLQLTFWKQRPPCSISHLYVYQYTCIHVPVRYTGTSVHQYKL
eukprot:COSAG02_NODE_7150_length_3155_cov_1125.431610_1_plen_122_part_00